MTNENAKRATFLLYRCRGPPRWCGPSVTQQLGTWKHRELLADMVGLTERLFVENKIEPTLATIVANALADQLGRPLGRPDDQLPERPSLQDEANADCAI